MKVIDLLNKRIAYSMKRGSLLYKKYARFPELYPLSWSAKIALAFCALLLFCGLYLYEARIVLHSSDNASILLQAYDFIHTSKILQGWYLPADSYVTIDMPFYVLGLLSGFDMPVLMKIIPALLYTGIVFSGMYLASFGKKGKPKILAIMAFLAIVAFPSYNTATQVLQGPIHIGTILGVLLALIAYCCYKEYSHKIVSLLILGILTLLLVVGDPMSEVILVAPILLVEGILLYKKRFRSRSQYAIIGTILSGTLCAFYVQHIWKHYIHIQTFNTLTFENMSTAMKRTQDAIQIVFSLFHGDFFQKHVSSPKIIPVLLNAAFILLLAIGTSKWVKKIFSLETSQDALITVLVLAMTGNLFFYIFTNISNVPVLRYLLPVFIFMGIVAFSLLSYIKKRELYIIILGVFMLNSSLSMYMLYRTPPAIQPENAVISFLQQKHLTKGIGQYWSAASITGQSNYAITIRQVKVIHNQIHLDPVLANDNWFSDDSLKDCQFIIYRTVDKGFYNASVGSFGKPDRVYTVGTYIILAWHTPLLRHTRPMYRFYIPGLGS